MPTRPSHSSIRRAHTAVTRIALATLTLSVIASPALIAQSATRFHQIASYTLGGDGFWDYLTLDTVNHRLFIARNDRVMVVDESSGKLLHEITGLHRTHGIAFDYRSGHGFVTGSGDSAVTMFDLKTLAPLGSAKAGAGADALIFDVASGHAFSFNGGANSATVIDGSTGSAVATISLGGRPEFAASDGAGKVFVNLEDSSAIVEIDSKTNRVTRRWSLAPCESPSGLAIDVAHHRLFSGCENKLMTISDYVAGKVVATAPIGSGVDANRFDPGTGLAFSSNGEGSITVVHEDSPDRFSVVQTVTTMPGARTMEIDPAAHKLFTVTARFGPSPAQATPDNPRRRPPIASEQLRSARVRAVTERGRRAYLTRMRVLLVEDDRSLADIIVGGMREQHLAVVVATNAAEARERAELGEYDVIVLDVMLPDGSGFELCAWIRGRGVNTPILMLTARDAVDDRVLGLEAGADDYLIKPFAFRELVARIRALGRRRPAIAPAEHQIADLHVDLSSHAVSRGGTPIELTAKEFALLEFFVTHAGAVVDRASITAHVWDENHDPFTNVLEVLVRRLRRKIDDDFEPKLIHTLRGAGYRFGP